MLAQAGQRAFGQQPQRRARAGTVGIGQQVFARRGDAGAVQALHAALAHAVKGAHAVDFIIKELNAQRVGLTGRIHIHNGAAQGALAFALHHVHALVARLSQARHQIGRLQLIARFTPKSYAQLLKKHRPNLIAGVPSLFEALLRVPEADALELSCLKGVFSGGDSLSVELKKRFDAFLGSHGATIKVREGYGTTECVTASCLTPMHKAKEGSIGLPFPDTYYKIVKPGTTKELPYGEEGEICLAGPTVMLCYVNHPKETADTMKDHGDGLIWVHTGDLGKMDEEGFIYFRQRIKRMIVTNGYNVYPSQIENVLEAHEAVHLACVIGVKDPIRVQRVKAFVMLKPGYEGSEELKKDILEHCSKYVARYAMPRELEFRPELPKTLVGKVAYRVLEEEEAAKEMA